MPKPEPGFYDGDDGNPIGLTEYLQLQAKQQEQRDKVHASMTPAERREWERRYATDTAHVKNTPPPVAPDVKAPRRVATGSGRPRASASSAASRGGDSADDDEDGPGDAGHLAVIPVALPELYSRLRAVRVVLEVAEEETLGKLVGFESAGDAVENIRHAREGLDKVLSDLQVWGVAA
jgi:hypothetical protein